MNNDGGEMSSRRKSGSRKIVALSVERMGCHARTALYAHLTEYLPTLKARYLDIVKDICGRSVSAKD